MLHLHLLRARCGQFMCFPDSICQQHSKVGTAISTSEFGNEYDEQSHSEIMFRWLALKFELSIIVEYFPSRFGTK